MPWEVLVTHSRQASTDWRIAIGSTGVAISFPKGHRFEKATHIMTMIGTGRDLGLVKITAANEGRKIQKPKNGKGACRIKYATLPKSPASLKTMILKVTDDPVSGSVTFRLPWSISAPVEGSTIGRSILDPKFR